MTAERKCLSTSAYSCQCCDRMYAVQEERDRLKTIMYGVKISLIGIRGSIIADEAELVRASEIDQLISELTLAETRG